MNNEQQQQDSGIPHDQRGFWTKEWQEGEHRASEQIAAGGLHVYGSMEDLFTSTTTSSEGHQP